MLAYTISTPIGNLILKYDDKYVYQLGFSEQILPNSVGPATAVLETVKMQLSEYFSGKRRYFNLPLAPSGTPFQQSVWQILRKIPFGEWFAYSQLAERLGNPKAVRAVARANARNPFSLAVPCHRVIGKKGALTGYAWGLERKAWLLSHEKQYA